MGGVGSRPDDGGWRTVEKLYAGNRLRQLREERGLRQAELARELGLSSSYLNQIEHDRRPLTPAVLLRLTALLGLAGDAFAPESSARQLSDLAEAAEDALDGEHVPATEIEKLAGLPTVARALLVLHRRQRDSAAQARALAGTGGGWAPMPYEEVRDFFYDLDNHVGELEVAAERLVAEEHLTPGHTAAPLTERLRSRHGIAVEEAPHEATSGLLRSYDHSSRRLVLAAPLRPTQRAFQIATQIALLEHADLLDRLVGDGRFTAGEARALARIGLANYFAGAVLMPYESFRCSAEKFRYEIERLCVLFDVGFESACHRLSNLQRPGAPGVPFAFVRVDRAGNISKRQSASSFHLSRIGGTCPLWVTYEAFSSPGAVLRQVAEMPDGRRYFWLARTVRRSRGGYGTPGKVFAVGLGCELRHAGRLVYSDGLDLSADAGAIPIGPGCRVCERTNCPQRAVPPAGRTIVVDEQRARFVPYTSLDPGAP
jgi:predicted transcriptional regulator/transcriptional regulator with XRE-family HTH domain